MNRLFIPIEQAEYPALLSSRQSVPADVLDGQPVHHAGDGFSSAEAGCRGGVWESSEGSWRVAIDGYTEFCTLLEGRVTVQEEGGATHTLRAGDSLVMRDGFRGQWTVTQRARKFFVIVNRPEA